MDDLADFEKAEMEVLGEVISPQRGGSKFGDFSEVFWPFEVNLADAALNSGV